MKSEEQNKGFQSEKAKETDQTKVTGSEPGEKKDSPGEKGAGQRAKKGNKQHEKGKRVFSKYEDLSGAQKRKLFIMPIIYVLVSVIVLSHFCFTLYNEKKHYDDSWNTYLQDTPEQAAKTQELSKNATVVTVGTYVENLRELNIRSSFYRVKVQVWFLWEGDPALNPLENFRIYKGNINSIDVYEESQKGNLNYQLAAVDVSVSKNFDTQRFPLDSQQLRFYIESTNPIEEVVFVPDYENSGMNENLALSGYRFVRSDIGAVSYEYDSNHGDPDLKGPITTSEIVTAMEINRSGFGLYFKCFIALAGTITWVLIALYICTYHRVDPLGMLPAALFGTVGNIMVGANLLPDALEMGLLEYVNLWGVITILGTTIVIITINNTRKKDGQQAFANLLGVIMFAIVTVLAIGGQIILPLSAYLKF